LETFFGLGLITGPTVGGALYQVGGYTTPFVVMGAALFLSAVMTALVLPEHRESEIDAKTGRKFKSGIFLLPICLFFALLKKQPVFCL
jgi:MFS family permease